MPSLVELCSAHCRPLRGTEHLLTAVERESAMRALPDWKVIEDDRAIQRRVDFPGYYQTMAFVNALAFIAHAEDHHPDLSVHYGHVLIRYSTHDVGGLSRNDVICAAKVELLLASRSR